jgi:flavin reductase (DIM6/NTAB) family NADH-FMN oxidoreductase RutF
MNIDADWDLNPSEMDPKEAYHLLTALVVPRPIGWVSTASLTGSRNLAPFGYYNMCSHSPPVLHITDTGSHTDTLRNIKATGEFVCNVVSYDLVEAMNYTAIPFPPNIDEFEWAGLTSASSVAVKPPRVAEARAALECRLRQFVPIGEDTMVLGDIVHVHVSKAVIQGGRVDVDLLKPVCRFSGNRYSEFTRMYKLPRPSWEEVDALGDQARLSKFRAGTWAGVDSVNASDNKKLK